MGEPRRAIDEASADQTAWALLITGAGDKFLSAGVDVMDHTPDEVVDMIDAFHGMLKAILACPIPTVAALNGSALGEGREDRPARDQAGRISADRGDPASEDDANEQGGGTPRGWLCHRCGRRQAARPHQPHLRGGLIWDRLRRIRRPVPVPFPGRTDIYETRDSRSIGQTFMEALDRVEHLYLKDLMATSDAIEGLNFFMAKRKPVWTNKWQGVPHHDCKDHQDLADAGAGTLDQTEIAMTELKPGEALVEIRGCGVCHTDLSHFYLGVPTVDRPPLALGHEISGVAVAGDEPDLIGADRGDQAVGEQVREFPDQPMHFGIKLFEVDRALGHRRLGRAHPICGDRSSVHDLTVIDVLIGANGIRGKKKFFRDQMKLPNRHWGAAT